MPAAHPPYESPTNGLYPLHFEQKRSFSTYVKPACPLFRRAFGLKSVFTSRAEEKGIWAHVSLATAAVRDTLREQREGDEERTPLFFTLSLMDEEEQMPKWTEAYLLLREMVEEYFPDPAELPGLQLKPPIIRCVLPNIAILF